MDDWLSLQNSVYLQLFLFAGLLFIGYRVFVATAKIVVKLVVIGLGVAVFASLLGVSVWGLWW